MIGGEQFLFGCVAAPPSVRCGGSRWDFRNLLDAVNPTDRYVAVKAAGVEDRDLSVEVRLAGKTRCADEDLRIRLEALGSLVRINPSAYITEHMEWITKFARGSKEEVALSMEGVFILSEHKSREALAALTSLAADLTLQPELRAAAVWGLGAAGADDAGRVLPFIADADDEVALHAIAGMGPLSGSLYGKLRQMIMNGSDREAASACELLMEEGGPGIEVLLEAAESTGRPRLWGLAALGRLSRAEVREAAEDRLTSRLEAILAPMWIEQSNWLGAQQNTSPVEFLRQQSVRHLGKVV